MPRSFSRGSSNRIQRALVLAALGAAPALAIGCGGEPPPPPSGSPNDLSNNGSSSSSGAGGGSGDEDAAPTPRVISGGTLAVLRDGRTAVAAEPDYDRVFIVDLVAGKVLFDVALERGDEPGRVVEDEAARAHVLLRGGGGVVTIDTATGEILARRAVCGAPRGVDYDAKAAAIHVACAGGELVTLPAAGGEATRTLRLERDLRDVVVAGDTLRVSLFRSAEILTVDAGGAVVERRDNPSFTDVTREFSSSVAWRMRSLPGGGVITTHQQSFSSTLPAAKYYNTPPEGVTTFNPAIVFGTVSVLRDDGEPPKGAAPGVPITSTPVDLAVSADGARFALAAPNSHAVLEGTIAGVEAQMGSGDGALNVTNEAIWEEPIAVAFDGQDRVVAQTRAPAGITILKGARIDFGLPIASHMGHVTFHQPASPTTSVACVSCHPEGRDDGHTWNFTGLGPRRTQALAGDVLGTAPFHWDGDFDSFEKLMEDVYVVRMGGAVGGIKLRATAVAEWLATVPTLPHAAESEASERGKALFRDPEVGCIACHAGEKLTNNATVDVGTGKAYQVPSLLGVGYRAPYLHDGCAATLHDRFTDPKCGGGDAHGKTSQLTPAQIDDLVAFLETL